MSSSSACSSCGASSEGTEGSQADTVRDRTDKRRLTLQITILEKMVGQLTDEASIKDKKSSN